MLHYFRAAYKVINQIQFISVQGQKLKYIINTKTAKVLGIVLVMLKKYHWRKQRNQDGLVKYVIRRVTEYQKSTF
nr:MAG TPA: hypothetical protein [Caudoviricetes sp.]